MKESTKARVEKVRKRLKRKREEAIEFIERTMYAQCRSILEKAQALDTGKLFYENPANLSGYSTYISHPMYFKLIEKRIKSYSYNTPQEFIDDMRLLIDNCYAFNTRKSPVSVAARPIEIMMESLFVTELGQAPAPLKAILSSGTNISYAMSLEILDLVRFYEEWGDDVDSSGPKKKVHITPAKYSCACQRRMLEALQMKSQHSDASRSAPKRTVKKPTATPPPPPAPVPAEDKALKLEAVPQNFRTEFAVGGISPVAGGDHSSEDDISFAEN